MKAALRSLFVLSVGLLSNPVSNGLTAVEASGGRGQGQRLLVRFRDGAAPDRIVSANRAANATVLKTFEFVKNLQVVSVPDGAEMNKCLAMYRSDDTVLYAEPDHRRFAQTVPNDPMFSDLWGLDNRGTDGGTVDADIDAPEGWEITQGSDDVVVAVIDTGIDYNHEDLAANMWVNEADCDNNGVDDDGNGYADDCHGIDSISGSGYPMDTTDCQHGTHVAGTIGAVGNNGKGVVGVNWRARLMALRFLSYDRDIGGCSGWDSNAIECFEYACRMKDRGVNVVAINNSWGGGDYGHALYDAVGATTDRGILCINAAGNDGWDNDIYPSYPASFYLPNVISVGATTSTDSSPWFTDYGLRTVHVSAPGYNILSTVPEDGYEVFMGTSMAAPHVTGLAALLKAQDANRDWRTIRNLIMTGGAEVDGARLTVSGRRIGALGSMLCSGKRLYQRLLPHLKRVIALPGESIELGAVNIDCGSPAGNVEVRSDSGESITLTDDGRGSDLAAGDGTYNATWKAPQQTGIYTLTFPEDEVTVEVVRGYTASVTDYEWVDIDGDGLFGMGTDEGFAEVKSPFLIPFGGGALDTLRISVNGLLTLGEAVYGYYNPHLPITQTDSLVAPFMQDLNFNTASAYWEVVGSAPNRKLVVEWRKARPTGCGDGKVTFQIVFYEDSPEIRFNYKDVQFDGTCPTADFGASALVGLQVGRASGTELSYYKPSLKDEMSIRWSLANTLLIDEMQLPDATAGIPYNAALSASGGTPPFNWSVVDGDLPPGLGLGAASGIIDGTPSSPGTYDFVVQVADSSSGQSQSAMRIMNLTVASGAPPLSVLTSTLPSGVVGTPYGAWISASGGAAPYFWSLADGGLPQGLSLDPATGGISGRPGAAGTTTLTIQCIDSTSPDPQVVSRTFQLTIDTAPTLLVIVTDSLPYGTLGSPYAAIVEATGGAGPYAWSATAGSLPSGLALDPSRGVIDGTPLTAGTFQAELRVTDSSSPTPQSVTAGFTIQIEDSGQAGELRITTTSLPSGTQGKEYKFRLEASGGSGEYRWSIASGNLPSGMKLNRKRGVMKGRPTSAGTSRFKVELTDHQDPNSTATAKLTITINR